MAKPRRTQEERSQQTQSALLNATLDCILEYGLKDTSTTLIAERARVSRGALMHHYPSKSALLQAALRHLLQEQTQSIREMADAVERGDLDINTFIDLLWEIFSGRMFMVSLEFVTASRTDPELKNVLWPVAIEFNLALDEIWEQLAHDRGGDREERRIAFNATLCFMRGLATQFIWRGDRDPEHFKKLLGYWKTALEDRFAMQGEKNIASAS